MKSILLVAGATICLTNLSAQWHKPNAEFTSEHRYPLHADYFAQPNSSVQQDYRLVAIIFHWQVNGVSLGLKMRIIDLLNSIKHLMTISLGLT